MKILTDKIKYLISCAEANNYEQVNNPGYNKGYIDALREILKLVS